MKKLLIIAALFCSMAVSAQVFEAPKKGQTKVDTTTTFQYKVVDQMYKVYKSKNGAFYIWRTSKKGKLYKYYLPKEVQIAMGRKYEDK